MIENKK
jgi:hypothetical protein